jgi:hypothetical protein
MKPKQKAIELIDKYQFLLTEKHFAKQCALTCCNEIIEAMDRIMLPNPFRQYWELVKDEIERL